jgi:hypothetical protein
VFEGLWALRYVERIQGAAAPRGDSRAAEVEQATAVTVTLELPEPRVCSSLPSCPIGCSGCGQHAFVTCVTICRLGGCSGLLCEGFNCWRWAMPVTARGR